MSRIELIEERISKLSDRTEGNVQSEQQKENRLKKKLSAEPQGTMGL